MNFRKFNHLITTQPHDIREVIISDLHLSEEEPAIVQAFLVLLNDLMVLPNLTKLYILGDWFELWIGDDAYLDFANMPPNHHLEFKHKGSDKAVHWIKPLINQLIKLRANGCHIFVMHGNRDFLIKQPFCDEFSGQLIDEPTFINLNANNIDATNADSNNMDSNENIGYKRIRLEHGDALCTDDKRYQKFRKYTRYAIVQWWLLRKPLHKRVELANTMREKSKKENAQKSMDIMDVNQAAVDNVMTNVDILIHGHTHRPAIHKLADGKIRYVLGDWRLDKKATSHANVSAVIGVIYDVVNYNKSEEAFSNNIKLVTEPTNIQQCFELNEFSCKVKSR